LHVLKSADIVIINGSKSKIFEEKILNINNKLDIFYSFYKPINLEKFKNKKLFAIAGIGNPKNFFKLLEENNLDVYEKLIFPDHYQFSKDEMIKIIENAKNKDCQIIMTEKDYYKINDYQLEELDYVKVSLEINQKEKLINKIRSKNVKSN
jgi:tetraacyldisaccharide 4'-kinase